MNHSLAGRDLISSADLSRQEMERIFHWATQLRKRRSCDLCKGAILASCFFEPSTRTRLSFEAAMHRLGGAVIGFAEKLTTSTAKGETLRDCVQVISAYSNILVLRHPLEGSARLAADISAKPVINAGDGANEHPTQTLLDLFTIQECQKKIDGLSIAIAGDLKHSRTVHSLVQALTHYSVRLLFISSEMLQLPEALAEELRNKGAEFSFHTAFDEVIPIADILYMTRLQKERLAKPETYPHPTRLALQHLIRAKPNLRILHPLPRDGEIDPAIDPTPHAYYFQQAQNGLYVRMALLATLLGKQ